MPASAHMTGKTIAARPWTAFFAIWAQRSLILQLVRREVLNRYKGSVLGLLWSIIYPLMLLAVYTFVFRVVFNARWDPNGGNLDYALVLFAGLIVFNFFSESLASSPRLLQSHVSFVKKVVFPLEILAGVVIGNALFHALVSLAVLLAAIWVVQGSLSWTLVLLPLIWLPLVMLTLGFVWLISALGVYLRDLNELINVALLMLFFMSPILYPVHALPEWLRPYMLLNPLAPLVEQTRSVALHGQVPGLVPWLLTLALSWLVAWLGFAWFQKTREGFADVL